MPTLIFEVPEDVVAASHRSPEEFMQELRLAAAAKWYEMGEISQSRAAALAGLSREAFIDALGRLGVSALQIAPEELEADLRAARGHS